MSLRAALLSTCLLAVALAGCVDGAEDPAGASAPMYVCPGGGLSVERDPAGSVTHGENITFHVTGTEGALGTVWLLDERSEEGPSVTHSFISPGPKHVEVRAFSPEGCLVVGSLAVDVENRMPIAHMEYRIVEDMLLLDASGSKDPNGDELSFRWSIDGEPVGTGERTVTSIPVEDAILAVDVTDEFGGTDRHQVRFRP